MRRSRAASATPTGAVPLTPSNDLDHDLPETRPIGVLEWRIDPAGRQRWRPGILTGIRSPRCAAAIAALARTGSPRPAALTRFRRTGSRAAVFVRPAMGPARRVGARRVVDPENGNALLGGIVAATGDMTGDGRPDVAVTTSQWAAIDVFSGAQPGATVDSRSAVPALRIEHVPPPRATSTVTACPSWVSGCRTRTSAVAARRRGS